MPTLQIPGMGSTSNAAQKYQSRTATASGFFNGGNKTQEQQKYILEGISLELEARSSYFTTLNNQGWVDCAIFNVKFDPENVYELVMARDLTENAQFEVQIISSDKRVLKERREFYLNNPEAPIRDDYSFTTFSINDIFQLRIKDVNEIFTTFRIAEMPLIKTRTDDLTYDEMQEEAKKQITHFVQIGGKQLKIRFFLSVNEAEI